MSDSVPSYLRLEVDLEREDGGVAPRSRPAAARLRGALGKGLVDAFCPYGEPRCDPKGKGRGPATASPGEFCRLAGACPYGVLFAASLTDRPPFALHVPDGGDAAEISSQALTVEVTLFGPAWRQYAWALRALELALGPGSGPGLRLVAVRRIGAGREGLALAGRDLAGLPADLAPDLLGLTPEPFVAPRPVAVELLSPTHLLSRGKPLPRDEPVPFEVLVKSTLDRFAGLFGRGASPVLVPEVRRTIEAEAAQVPLLEQDLREAEESHYSRRSRTRLDLGGTAGRLVYGPRAAAFAHILHTAEILHLGKNTTFGCGRLRVDLVE